MKQLLKNMLHPGSHPTNVNVALVILRVVIGIFMLTHGIGKFQHLFGSEPIEFGDPIGIGATASLSLVVFAEFFCSFLLIIGLGTRFAAITLLINMLVIAFVVHIDDGFGRQEFALLYAVIYLTIAIIGTGKYSLDYLLTKKNNINK